MLIQPQADVGEGLGQPTESQHTPTTASPSHVEPIPTVASSSHPKKTKKHRKTKRKATEISQSSGPTTLVADETVHKERGDSVERAATTATSLDAEQGNGGSPRRQDTILRDRPAQTRFERLSKQSNDPPLSRVNTLRSGEDSMKLQELMDLCIKLSERVLALEIIKTAQDLEITNLKKRVKKLEKKKKSRTPQLKRRLFKTQGRYGHDISTAEVTTASVPSDVDVSAASPIRPVDDSITDDITLAETLMKIKSNKKARLEREREEEASKAANIAEWDYVQAMMDADYELAAKLQVEEQGEISIEERSILFVELMDKRKKHFAKLRANEQRRKPPTKTQKRNIMSTYLKNMAGYKHTQLKNKSFEEIQMLFEKEMKRVNIFVDMDAELVKGREIREESGSKRAGDELEQESSKRQMVDDDDKEREDLKQCFEIVPDEEFVVHVIPLAVKPARIKLVKTKHGYTRPEEAYERVLWGDLKLQLLVGVSAAAQD
ncbi:hypothetical protein Tco_1163279 [Tanacetum coccineum]